MDDPHRARDIQFDLVRYPALVQLWYHHNQMQLQWPALIVGTALLFLAYIIVSKASRILDVAAWGHDRELIFVVGLPMALTGVGLLVILHLMKRARLIMRIIEDQLIEMEQGRVDLTFSDINHPPGRSGARFIWYFMLVCLALPMLVFGILFSFGIVRFVAALIAVLFLIGGVKLVGSYSSLRDNSEAGAVDLSDRRLHSSTFHNAKIWLVNTVSLLRLFATLIFAWLALKHVSPILLSCLYSFAMVSDLIDGYLSRKLKAETYFGKVLDLVADKSLTIVSLLYAATCGIDLFPLAVIATRDIIMIGMRLVSVERAQLLPTNRIVGGIMALLIWGNTLVLVYARTGEWVRVANVIYWACAFICVVNLAARVYVSAGRIRVASSRQC